LGLGTKAADAIRRRRLGNYTLRLGLLNANGMKKKGSGYRYAVRIIGGRWRGRRLVIPPGTDVRPTPDRVRETLFNWLTGSLTGARCLDLFAGTGALGLEALSRGARDAWLVERDPVLAEALRGHVKVLEADARVLQSDASALLKRRAGERFDIVFLDAPYRLPLAPIMSLLSPWLSPEAAIYVERSHRPGVTDPFEAEAAALPGARTWKLGRAGEVVFGLLRVQRT